jgi:hypothetical protein
MSPNAVSAYPQIAMRTDDIIRRQLGIEAFTSIVLAQHQRGLVPTATMPLFAESPISIYPSPASSPSINSFVPLSSASLQLSGPDSIDSCVSTRCSSTDSLATSFSATPDDAALLDLLNDTLS